jgi:hypothetical protein
MCARCRMPRSIVPLDLRRLSKMLLWEPPLCLITQEIRVSRRCVTQVLNNENKSSNPTSTLNPSAYLNIPQYNFGHTTAMIFIFATVTLVSIFSRGISSHFWTTVTLFNVVLVSIALIYAIPRLRPSHTPDLRDTSAMPDSLSTPR